MTLSVAMQFGTLAFAFIINSCQCLTFPRVLNFFKILRRLKKEPDTPKCRPTLIFLSFCCIWQWFCTLRLWNKYFTTIACAQNQFPKDLNYDFKYKFNNMLTELLSLLSPSFHMENIIWTFQWSNTIQFNFKAFASHYSLVFNISSQFTELFKKKM